MHLRHRRRGSVTSPRSKQHSSLRQDPAPHHSISSSASASSSSTPSPSASAQRERSSLSGGTSAAAPRRALHRYRQYHSSPSRPCGCSSASSRQDNKAYQAAPRLHREPRRQHQSDKVLVGTRILRAPAPRSRPRPDALGPSRHTLPQPSHHGPKWEVGGAVGPTAQLRFNIAKKRLRRGAERTRLVPDTARGRPLVVDLRGPDPALVDGCLRRLGVRRHAARWC